jgi:hypothetical protein
MQAMAWLGFATGTALLLLTGSSVVRTLPYARLMACANT